MTIRFLGKYELLELLGEGATSEVYHARDTALGREVALKVLKPSLVADASAFERFSREAHAAAGLFHPNIATVLDMGEAGGRYFIAMRYFKGQSLDKILKERSPLSWNETLRMVAQIGSALDHAHQQGFLHRDVKPGNIIRAENGDFILTDFGLTRAMMITGLTSHTGAVLGTPAYIAPEIWNGEQATPATDQYALACVVYECLTGKVLFTGDTPPAVMTRHVLHGPQIAMDWPIPVPEGFGDSLRHALAANPAERFLSLDAFTTILRGISAYEAVSTRAESQPNLPQPASLVDSPEVIPKQPQPQTDTTPLRTPKESQAASQKPRKKPVAWPWIGAGLVATVCVCVGLLAGINLIGSLLQGASLVPMVPYIDPTDSTNERNDIPNGGLGDEILRTDTWLNVSLSAAMNDCVIPLDGHKNTSIDVLQVPDEGGVWKERWEVPCEDSSKRVFTITFTPAASGGTDLSIEAE